MPIQEAPDGSIYIGGTTANMGSWVDGQPPVNSPAEAFMIKVDANLSIQWRTHYKIPDDDLNCIFGLTLLDDGSVILSGNNEKVDLTSPTGEKTENYSFIKFGPDCEEACFTFNGSEDITDPVYTIPNAYEVWSTNRKVRGQVIVPANKILVINGATIEFGYGLDNFGDGASYVPGGIRVKKGGTLRVINATLTGLTDCFGGEHMWNGVTIEGDPEQPQQSYFQTGPQGQLYTSNATFKNAVNAVVVGAADYETIIDSEQNTTPGTVSHLHNMYYHYHTSATQGGGILRDNYSTYKNNYSSVEFTPYPNYRNRSRLTSSDFINTDNMLDERFGAGIDHFARLELVQSVPFTSCTFDGNENIAPAARGTAIDIVESRVRVDGSGGVDFQDLYTGIEANGPFRGLTNTLTINGNLFKNVYQSMNLRTTVGDQITNNTVQNIPDAPNTWGIFANAAQAFNYAQNTFSDGNKAIGICVNNSGGQGAEEFNNDFNSLEEGSQFEQDNPALSARCNDYELIGDYAWDVTSGELGDQGKSSIGNEKANNAFKDFCFGTAFSHINSAIAFNYYDKTGNPFAPDPDCVSPVVNLEIENDQSLPDCGDPAPCGTPDNPKPCEPEDFREQYESSEKGVIDRNRLLRAFVHWDSWGAIPDSSQLVELDSALNFLAQRNQPEDHRLLVSTLTALGRYTEADSWLGQIGGSDPESLDFIGYYSTLIHAGLAENSIYELDSADQATVLSFTQASTAMSKVGEAADYLLTNTYHPLQPESGGGGSAGKAQNAQPGPNPAKANVSPNPFSERVVFSFTQAPPQPYTIEVMNLQGLLLWKHTTDQAKIAWQPEDLPSGIYFYTISRDDGSQIASGKLYYCK